MRKLLAVSLLLLPALALAVSPPERLRAPVVVPAIGFTAQLADGRVLLKWHRYKRDDFYGYALLRSDKDEPVYAPKKAFFETHNVADLSFEDGRIAVGTYRYRVVVITSFGDLWMSPVLTVNVGPADLQRPVPTVADFE